ncbi:MAG: hypothetical protein V4505_22260 [Pseudomonadota bacterium]
MSATASFAATRPRRPLVDFHAVESAHRATDARLLNWARWVQARGPAAQTCPMFRMAKSSSRQWHAPEHTPQTDAIDAQKVEKLVAGLPPPHRDALRWCYVAPCSPGKACRALAVSMEGLARLVRDGRQMVGNRAAA